MISKVLALAVLLPFIAISNKAKAVGIIQTETFLLPGGTVTLQRGDGNTGTLTTTIDFANGANNGNANIHLIGTIVNNAGLTIGQPPNPVNFQFQQNNVNNGRYDFVVTANDGTPLPNTVAGILAAYEIVGENVPGIDILNIRDNGSVLTPAPPAPPLDAPGPLPVLGAIYGFTYSRKIRKRLLVSKSTKSSLNA